jgi:hypothetical protein
MNSENKRAIAYLVVIVGIIALTVPLMRSQSAAHEQADRFQRSFNVSSGGSLDVDNYKGTIHVTGSDTNQVTVDVTKRFDGSESTRKWWMENLQIKLPHVRKSCFSGGEIP